MNGEEPIVNVLVTLESAEKIYIIRLTKGEEHRYFTSFKEAGGYIGVSPGKVCHNKGKTINGLLITPCHIVETYNLYTGNVWETKVVS